MVRYCSASTHDCLHEQLSMAREALAENEKLARIFQEAEAMEAKMVQKLQDLEVKLQESQETVQRLRQDQASWSKTFGTLVVVFAFVYWCVMNYPN